MRRLKILRSHMTGFPVSSAQSPVLTSSSPTNWFRGKVAVITGAGNGIGRAFALKAAELGMKLFLLDIDISALKAVYNECSQLGVETHIKEFDVTKFDQIPVLVKAIYEKFGSVHLFFNNAGVFDTSFSLTDDIREVSWIFNVNVLAPLYFVNAFLPRMVASGERCHIVNTGSIAGLGTSSSLYAITKHAIVSMSEAIFTRMQAEQSQVRAHVLCPALVNTNLISNTHRVASPEIQKIMDGATAEEKKINEFRKSVLAEVLSTKTSPKIIADITFDHIEKDKFWIFPWNDTERTKIVQGIKGRFEDMIKGENPDIGKFEILADYAQEIQSVQSKMMAKKVSS